MTQFQPHLTLVSADDYNHDASHHDHPHVVFGYTVQPENCNRLGNMHGGATATLFDFCTSLALALAATPAPGTADANADADGEEELVQSWRRLGVSRTLAVTYVRPAPSGMEVLIDCEQLHAGRRMSSLRGVLRRRSDGAVLATCEHGKVVQDAKL